MYQLEIQVEFQVICKAFNTNALEVKKRGKSS
jgi:hypothetical protein